MRIYGWIALLAGTVSFCVGWWLIFHERHGYVGAEAWIQGAAAGSALIISGALAVLAGGYALAKGRRF